MKPGEMQDKLFCASISHGKRSSRTNLSPCPDRKLPINTPNSARIIRKVFTDAHPEGQSLDGNKILNNRKSLEVSDSVG